MKILEGKANTQDYDDTEEMMPWRYMGQYGINEMWREVCGNMEKEVLDMYKVEEVKKGACKGRGQQLNWRIVKKVKRWQLRK